MLMTVAVKPYPTMKNPHEDPKKNTVCMRKIIAGPFLGVPPGSPLTTSQSLGEVSEANQSWVTAERNRNAGLGAVEAFTAGFF